MKNTLIALLLLPIVCTFNLKAQPYFQKLIYPGFGYYEEAHRTYNGIIICGTDANDSVGLIKTDSIGNVAWSYKYLPNCYYPTVVELPDSGFIVATVPLNLFRVSKTGAIIWCRSFNIQEAGPVKLIRIPGNKFLVTGTCQSTPNGNPFLLKFDISGNVLWSKLYPFSPFLSSLPYDIIPTRDSAFLISGLAADTSHSAYWERGLFIKVDSLGNVLWAKKIIGSVYSDEYRVTNCIELPSGAFLAYGADESSYNNYLVKIDASGTILFAKHISSGYAPVKMIQQASNRFEFSTLNEIGCMDSLGNISYMETYGDTFPKNFSDIEPINSSSLLCGHIEHIIWNKPGTYLVKIDSTGDAGCHQAPLSPSSNTFTVNTVSFSIPNTSLNLFSSFVTVLPVAGRDTTYDLCMFNGIPDLKRELLSAFLYPNPCSNVLHIESSHDILSYTLFDIAGRDLSGLQHSVDEKRIDVSELQEGLYFLKLNFNCGTRILKFLKTAF